jgi:aconitate hydratase
VAAAVISGNRNFEGRVHPHVKANYLASPPLVVAYAIAGTVDRDLGTEPLGTAATGNPVFLKDIWPTAEEVANTITRCITPAMYAGQLRRPCTRAPRSGRRSRPPRRALRLGDADSTYIQSPPFFQGLTMETKPVQGIEGARCLALLGDSVTTDHISPAGDIAADSPAGGTSSRSACRRWTSTRTARAAATTG